MDEVLSWTDDNFFTPYVYPKEWEPTNIWRQAVSLFLITLVGGFFTYFFFAGINFIFIFDKNLLKHPKILPNQIQKEISTAIRALPFMVALTVPFFLLEVRGHTYLYDSISERSVGYTAGMFLLFLAWNDCLVYWVHRWLHHPYFYKALHKEHHKWLVPTPFASHAFHPLDGFMQGLPYHLFVMVFPFPKWLYFTSFLLVNFWTISIHDGQYQVPDRFYLREMINGAAHHTDHHLFFSYNLGLYFTFWDRIGGTYRNPSPYEGNGPQDQLRAAKLID